jgi:hypothetical protein
LSKNFNLFTALGKGAIRMSEGLTKYFGVYKGFVFEVRKLYKESCPSKIEN